MSRVPTSIRIDDLKSMKIKEDKQSTANAMVCRLVYILPASPSRTCLIGQA